MSYVIDILVGSCISIYLFLHIIQIKKRDSSKLQ